MTDVNISVELLADAFQNKFDTALLVSGDSDLTGPIKKIKELFSYVKNITVPFSAENAFIVFISLEKNEAKTVKEMACELYQSKLFFHSRE